jgi:AcrR family transcriptional regulator
MQARAEKLDETRMRIVEAAVRLHGTIGPAATTVSALAEEAGVTRLTVYRHFPEAADLFRACSQHWGAGRTYPDPSAWGEIDDPVERLRFGLSDVYRFYAEGEPMLTRIQRDYASVPAELRDLQDARRVVYRDRLLDPFRSRGARRGRLRAAIGHAISFWTWRSLVIDEGMSSDHAVEAMVAMVTSMAADGT